jgi:hypothetical protein
MGRTYSQISDSVVVSTRNCRMAGTSRFVGRASPYVVIVVGVYDVGKDARQWRRGGLSDRQFYTSVSVKVPGYLAAAGGAYAGAKGGAALGALGGPIAWITVPAGGFLGGLGGSIVGYAVGSKAVAAVAESLYGKLDAANRQKYLAFLQNHYTTQ